MNQQLRDSIRAKHSRLDQHQGKIGAATYCQGCKSPTGVLTTAWPCDVIKVLDTWESVVHDGSEVSTTREVCEHADWTSNVYSEDIYADMGYRYCPKCGEKL